MKNDTCTKTQYIELTEQELDSIDGGNPLSAILWGIVGAYVYEMAGGANGINNAVRSLGTNLKELGRSYTEHSGPLGFPGQSVFRLPS